MIGREPRRAHVVGLTSPTRLLRAATPRLRGLHRNGLARSASWMLAGQGASFFLKAGYFVFLARLLGAREYGIFAGVFALVNVLAPYCCLGSDLLFMRYVIAKDSDAPVYWGNAIFTTVTMTLLIAMALAFAGPLISGSNSVVLIVCVVFANCLFTQMLTVASRVFQTYDRMQLSALLLTLSNLSRFVVLLVMWIGMRHATAVQWSLGMLVAAVATTAAACVLVHKAVPTIRFDLRLLRSRLGEGISYSFGDTAMAIYNDFDKTLLSHYGMNFENGFYSLAYRILDFCCTPIWSINQAVLPRYFALHQRGLAPVLRLLGKTLAVAVCIASVVACAVWLMAPLAPPLVGRDFAQIVPALRWLCLIPVLRATHGVIGGSLTATGHQKMRLAAQFTVAILNLGLNLLWIPTHGWRGAAWASLASDASLALLAIVLVSFVAARERTRQWRLTP